MDQYAYFVGCLILLSVWFYFYFLRRDLRKELFFGSFLALPFGFTEMLFVHEYWNPPSILGLIDRFGFGIEDFLFMFAVGGIAAISYEVLFNSKVKKFKSNKKFGFTPFILAVTLFFSLEIYSPSTSIYNMYMALFIGTLYLLFLRKDLFKQIVTSGFIFTFLYFFLFTFFNTLYPDYVDKFYVHKNLIGLSIRSIPVEELLFAFFWGAFWSVMYEFIKNYRAVRK